jgi:hypothetical protein
VLCAAAGLVIVLLPGTNGTVTTPLSNVPAQLVTTEPEVPVTRARRAKVNALFDAFVPAAVERNDPETAYDLVTPAFRAGASREAWRRGDLPVYPYEPAGRTFHGWTVDISYRDSMSVELYLQPRNPSQGALSVNVDLKRMRGRWLIDSFYPRQSYGAAAAAQTTPGGSKTKEAAPAPSSGRSRSGLMLLFLAAFLTLVIAAPLCLLGLQSLRARRGRRRAG